LVKATTDGVVRAPSWLTMTVGSLPSIAATTELAVPRSIPITLVAMLCSTMRRWPREMEPSKTRPAILAQNAEQSARCVPIFATSCDEPANVRRELTAVSGHEAAHTGDGVARQLPNWSD
jgi:hypothetical protein